MAFSQWADVRKSLLSLLGSTRGVRLGQFEFGGGGGGGRGRGGCWEGEGMIFKIRR